MSSIGNSLEKKIEGMKHRTEMNSLRERHKVEKGKTENTQHRELSELKLNHRIKLNDTQSQHERAVLKKQNADEKTLTKMQQSLDSVKNKTNAEKAQLAKNLEDQRAFLVESHNADFQHRSAKNNMVLQDLNDEANVEIQQIQRRINAKRAQMKAIGRESLSAEKDSHNTKLTITRDKYVENRFNESKKHERDLTIQHSKNVKQLAAHERTQQAKLVSKKGSFDKAVLKTEELGQKRIQDQQKQFENTYNNLHQKQEKTLQRLVGKKEVIIDKLRDELVSEYKLGLSRKEDNFFDFKKMNVKLDTKEDGSGYLVKIKVAPYAANKIKLTADTRIIKLQMDRNYKTNKTDNGVSNSMNRIETYNSQMTTNEIMDPKSVNRSYKNGVLTFDIGLA